MWTTTSQREATRGAEAPQLGASGLGLNEKFHAWAPQRFGLFLT